MARVTKTYANLARTLAQLKGEVSANRQEIHVHYHTHAEQPFTRGERVKLELNLTQLGRSLVSIQSMLVTPRCETRARTTGSRCRSPAVKGKRVCKIHGGAKGSGAPSGVANGSFRHGSWAQEAVAARREAVALLKSVRSEAQA